MGLLQLQKNKDKKNGFNSSDKIINIKLNWKQLSMHK